MNDKLNNNKIAVMGHICLDLYPSIKNIADIDFVPGKLSEIGPCSCSPGGAVGNTGLVLEKLGIPVKLLAKIGDDSLGETLSSFFTNLPPDAQKHIVAVEGNTAYSIVINPEGHDRMFLAYRGVNDQICYNDLTDDFIEDTAILHFGYPPLCKTIAENNGNELKKIFRYVQDKGIITSLDMSLPSPGSSSEKINWLNFLKNVMPQTDIFLPSIDELLFMFKAKYSNITEALDTYSKQLLDWGAAVIVIKLGSDGFYVRTTTSSSRINCLKYLLSENVDNWRNKKFSVPCYKVKVKGTTGAGDATIAGFLSGMLNGFTIEKTAQIATGVGALCVTQHDATSGITPLEDIIEKVHNQ
ncbi:MAG: carbohydrate kinase family protein [Sedimentisphaeraceae bacterium JB056]